MDSRAAHVRDLEPRDLEHVARLFRNDMHDLGYDLPTQKLVDLLRATLDDDGRTCRCWVATRDPEAPLPIGAILVNFYRSIKFAGPSLWIEGLYVDPDHRRRGIGRILVEHVLDWAEPREFVGIDLEAYQTNTPAAVLYRSLGFRRLGRARFSLDFSDLDR